MRSARPGRGSRVGPAILTTWGQWVVTGLVMVGLLLTPVTCPLVDHPHSLFDTPDALERSGHAAHAAHQGAGHATGHAAHPMTMVNGAPPLAGSVPLPELDRATVQAWLAANPAGRGGPAAGAVASTPGLGDLPSVAAMTMAMVASSASALHVTLLLLLAVALIARRPYARATTLVSRAVATLAPPPRRTALI